MYCKCEINASIDSINSQQTHLLIEKNPSLLLIMFGVSHAPNIKVMTICIKDLFYVIHLAQKQLKRMKKLSDMYGAHKLFPRLDGRYGNISLFSYISVLKYELSVLYVTDVLRSRTSLSNTPVVTRCDPFISTVRTFTLFAQRCKLPDCRESSTTGECFGLFGKFL